MIRLGADGPDLWQRARSRCTACGSEGLQDEGHLTAGGDGVLGHVDWVGEPPATHIFGFTALDEAARHRVRALRCRECRHLELFAEDPE